MDWTHFSGNEKNPKGKFKRLNTQMDWTHFSGNEKNPQR